MYSGFIWLMLLYDITAAMGRSYKPKSGP
jgi:hypothetical protein